MTLAPLNVPNTLLIGQGTGDNFNVTAADVVGSIELGADGQSNADYYAITATAGELLNFQVLSAVADPRCEHLRSTPSLRSTKPTARPWSRTTAAPPVRPTTTASRTSTASCYDLIMPYTGTYYVKVSTYSVTDSLGIVHNSDIGDYELFMYSFATSSSDAAPATDGDTLIGGSGQDTLIGSSASDLIEVVPGDSVSSGSGADTVDVLPYDIAIADPPLQVGSPVALDGSFVASNPGMAYTYDWHVVSSNGQVIDDGSGTAAVSNGTGTTAFQFTPMAAGAYTITLTLTDGYGGVNQATLAETVGTITPFTTQIGTGASQITGTSGTPVNLTATATGSYPVSSYSWVVAAPGTATPPAPGSSSSYTFTPTAAGDYLVTMTATDTAGDVSVSILTVIVPYVAPSVQIVGVPANEYVAEGYPFSLAGIVNDPTSEDNLTESWTVTAADGSEAPYTESGPSVTYTPDDIGSYTVTLNLLDAGGQVVASVSQQIISIGVAPTATISGGPQGGTTTEGTSLSFTGAASSPSTVTSANGFYYSWSVMLGQYTYVAPTTSTTPTINPSRFSFTPGQAGNYVVSLSVTDDHGFTSVAATQTVAVAAVAPSVTITGLPTGSVTEGTTVALGSVVTNPSTVLESVGFSESWTVQFGGAAYGPFYGPALNITLGAVGSYTVELTATDAEGISSTATQVITAADTAPVLTPSTSPTTQPPQQATITEYNFGSVAGPGLVNNPGFVTVNWGDGSPATTFQISSQGSLGLQAHAYELPGNYQVTVTVVDIYGLSGSESFTTTVAPVAPAPEIEGAPASVNSGSSVTLNSSVTDFSQVETALGFTYSWSVLFNGAPITLPGDPATNGPNLDFTPEVGGTYTVELSTTDASGSIGTAPAQTIVVNNVPPTASFSGLPASSPAGTAITLTGSATDPSTVDTAAGFTFKWTVTGPGSVSFTGNSTTAAPGFTFKPVVAGGYTVAMTAVDSNDLSGSISQTITIQDVAPSLGSISAPSTVSSGVAFSVSDRFTDPDPDVTHTAVWNWGDSTTSAGTVTEPNGSTPGQVAGSHTYTMAGTYTITLTLTGSDGLTAHTTAQVATNQSIIVLDPTAGGALSLSGNATIDVPGLIAVDSSATTAVSASGNASVTASSIQVVGKVQKSGNAKFNPTPTTGAKSVADPLSGLSLPTPSGLTNHGAESLSGNAKATIQPGIYSGIAVSGNAVLTLASGIYIIEGGGLAVSGNASIAGSGVMIVNAGSNYPNTGGTYGSISLSGNGTYSLSPPTSGTYAGIVIFQPRDNTKELTLSGNASGMNGTVYAAAAQLSESGNAQLEASLIVDTLTISGNGTADGLTLDSPQGTEAYSPAQVRSAYGLDAPGAGLTTPPWDGTGQTIAIVDAYDNPSIYLALDAFDSQFGLTSTGSTLYDQYGPSSSFLTVLNQEGQATSLPGTDPSGAGGDNWEVEESLDVEWAHAIAPGAQIILVEANSQSLSDLMAAVATAASRPGVSVVSMSWGFAEGQSVLAADEATYDGVFNVPGVTFVASTGDHGAAAPQYPAFSPNVVAVGGTSLTINADGSYNSETGFGYQSTALGTFIGSGGGISLYEPEPAYQEGVQSTGRRTIPDVALVADPATGAWIADPYKLPGDDPFEVAGGTSLSAPCWAGLVALANQGRGAADEPTLDSSSPTDTLQALYSLPQSDYNIIGSGSNGYAAAAGYNLVTGLGSPVADLLVPDLVAYQGPETTYSGPIVAAMANAELVNAQASTGGTADAFTMFDSFVLTTDGTGYTRARGAGTLDDGMMLAGRSRLVQNDPRPDGGGGSDARRVDSVPSVPGPILTSVDRALIDGIMALDMTTSSMNTAARIHPDDSPGVGTGTTSPSSQRPDVVDIDAATLDALLSSGWRARSTWVADRPRQSIKRFL